MVTGPLSGPHDVSQYFFIKENKTTMAHNPSGCFGSVKAFIKPVLCANTGLIKAPIEQHWFDKGSNKAEMSQQIVHHSDLISFNEAIP